MIVYQCLLKLEFSSNLEACLIKNFTGMANTE
jgi:hypothetical protein